MALCFTKRLLHNKLIAGREPTVSEHAARWFIRIANSDHKRAQEEPVLVTQVTPGFVVEEWPMDQPREITPSVSPCGCAGEPYGSRCRIR